MIEVYNERVTDLLAGVSESQLETDEAAFAAKGYDFTTGVEAGAQDAVAEAAGSGAGLAIREVRPGAAGRRCCVGAILLFATLAMWLTWCCLRCVEAGPQRVRGRGLDEAACRVCDGCV